MSLCALGPNFFRKKGCTGSICKKTVQTMEITEQLIETNVFFVGNKTVMLLHTSYSTQKVIRQHVFIETKLTKLSNTKVSIVFVMFIKVLFVSILVQCAYSW